MSAKGKMHIVLRQKLQTIARGGARGQPEVRCCFQRQIQCLQVCIPSLPQTIPQPIAQRKICQAVRRQHRRGIVPAGWVHSFHLQTCDRWVFRNTAQIEHTRKILAKADLQLTLPKRGEQNLKAQLKSAFFSEKERVQRGLPAGCEQTWQARAELRGKKPSEWPRECG